MAVSRAKKEKLRSEVAERFISSSSTIITEYKGLSVAELTELRTELRKSDSKFQVVKNRVVKKAIESDATDFEGLKDEFKGPVGVVFCKGDPCLLYTSPSPRDGLLSRMPSSA